MGQRQGFQRLNIGLQLESSVEFQEEIHGADKLNHGKLLHKDGI